MNVSPEIAWFVFSLLLARVAWRVYTRRRKGESLVTRSFLFDMAAYAFVLTLWYLQFIKKII
jgi:hypothetical protein